MDSKNMTKEELGELRKEIVLNSLFSKAYENSFDISAEKVQAFFDGFVEDSWEQASALGKEEDWDKIFDNPDSIYDYYCSVESPFGEEEEQADSDDSLPEESEESDIKDKQELPKEITIDGNTMEALGILGSIASEINGDEIDGDEIESRIGDWLSDTYGFCHFGFEYDVEPDHINVYNIQWDTSCEDDDLDRLKQLKDLYDSEPEDLTDDEIEELKSSGMLEEDTKGKTNMNESEDKPLVKSKYKQAIGKYFNYTADFEFLDVVASVLDRVDDVSDEESISEAIDSALSYYKERWTIMEHYFWSDIENANWDDASGEFTDDIYALCASLVSSSSEDEE